MQGRKSTSRARRVLTVALIAAAAIAPQAASAQDAEGTPPTAEEIGLLFSHTAKRGTLEPLKGAPGGRLALTLRGVSRQVVWFSDRPARQSGHLLLADWVSEWASLGFVDDPPNAALTVLDAADHQDTVVLTLGKPRYTRSRDRIRYPAQLLDEATGNLSHHEPHRDSRVPRHFDDASLFVDDAVGWTVGGCLIQPYTVCTNADLRGARIGSADLTGANFSGTDLSGADLSGAFLREANLTGATLDKTKLAGATLSSANLTRGILTGANLESANLRRGNLSDAVLNGAYLYGANLPDAKLAGAKLAEATLQRVNFARADLARANLFGAFAVGSIFEDADLSEANLSSAQLNESVFTRANFTRADFTAASLFASDLSGAELKEANLSAAYVLCRTKMPDGSYNDRDCPWQ